MKKLHEKLHEKLARKILSQGGRPCIVYTSCVVYITQQNVCIPAMQIKKAHKKTYKSRYLHPYKTRILMHIFTYSNKICELNKPLYRAIHIIHQPYFYSSYMFT